MRTNSKTTLFLFWFVCLMLILTPSCDNNNTSKSVSTKTTEGQANSQRVDTAPLAEWEQEANRSHQFWQQVSEVDLSLNLPAQTVPLDRMSNAEKGLLKHHINKHSFGNVVAQYRVKYEGNWNPDRQLKEYTLDKLPNYKKSFPSGILNPSSPELGDITAYKLSDNQESMLISSQLGDYYDPKDDIYIGILHGERGRMIYGLVFGFVDRSDLPSQHPVKNKSSSQK